MTSYDCRMGKKDGGMDFSDPRPREFQLKIPEELLVHISSSIVEILNNLGKDPNAAKRDLHFRKDIRSLFSSFENKYKKTTKKGGSDLNVDILFASLFKLDTRSGFFYQLYNMIRADERRLFPLEDLVAACTGRILKGLGENEHSKEDEVKAIESELFELLGVDLEP